MANLLGLHPVVRRRMESFVAALRKAGYMATLTSAYRSPAEQERLYKLRLAGRHPLPVARPGCSTHQYGVAFDLVTDFPAEFRARLARQHGLQYAGPSDPVHYDPFGFAAWSRIVRQAGVC